MWDMSAERTLLEARMDAAVLLEVDTMTVIYQNQAAKDLLLKSPDKDMMTLLSIPEVQSLLREVHTASESRETTLSMAEMTLTLCAVPLLWEGREVVMLSLQNRDILPQQTISAALMRLLEKQYFAILEISLKRQTVTVVFAQSPMLSAHACYASYAQLFESYAQIALHSADRQAFLDAFSEERLQACAVIQETSAVSVRRMHDGLYSWARFSLSPVDEETVLFIGEDVNEEHLEQERTEQYKTELKTLSLRNSYTLSCISDIFRLMLHLDITTGDTLICCLHPSLSRLFSYDKVYSFSEITETLLRLVHPDDVEPLRAFSTMDNLRSAAQSGQTRFSFEYRRMSQPKGLDAKPEVKWTRSVIILRNFRNGVPTEAFYAVQDVHERKMMELEAKNQQKTFLDQFHMLLQHRYLWFIDSDYSAQCAVVWKIDRDNITQYMECPFSRLFEKVLIPFCHPEDIKKLATIFLPEPVRQAFHDGQKKIVSEFRMRMDDGFQWMRIEMDLLSDAHENLRSLCYICNIDREKQRMDAVANAEHKQLVLRRKFGLTVQDSYIRIGEIDLDNNVIYHYSLQKNDFVTIKDKTPFSELARSFAESSVYPDHRQIFEKKFSYARLLHASRENVSKIENRLLLDLDGSRQYLWCNLVVRFSHDADGKAFLMSYIEDIHAQITAEQEQLQELQEARERLQSMLRMNEQTRIRKAHIFSNIVADAKLYLNRVFGSVAEIKKELPEQTADSSFEGLRDAGIHLDKLLERARDILMLENEQLMLLQEKTSLPNLLRKLKQQAADTFHGKHLDLIAYTSHVQNEMIYCDSARVEQLLENIFINLIRCLPADSKIILRLMQKPQNAEESIALYEFSLISFGDTFSQDWHKRLCAPLHTLQNTEGMERSMFLDATQQNLGMHISKKLVAMMNGSLNFVTLPDGASAVTVRIPFRYAEAPACLFPQLYFYGKYALILESEQECANAITEMLQEAGMHTDWVDETEQAFVMLADAAIQRQPYALLFVRQAELNQASDNLLAKLQQAAGNATIMLLEDALPQANSCPDTDYPLPYKLETPLFRSILAKHLWDLYQSESDSAQ